MRLIFHQQEFLGEFLNGYFPYFWIIISNVYYTTIINLRIFFMHTELKGMSEKGINQLRGFIDFIIERGVVGLAIGFILGGAVTKMVSSLVTDLINPLIGLILGNTKGLESAKFDLLGAKIMYGHFLSTTLDFLIIAMVVYFMVKILGLGKLDKKK